MSLSLQLGDISRSGLTMLGFGFHNLRLHHMVLEVFLHATAHGEIVEVNTCVSQKSEKLNIHHRQNVIVM